MLSIPMQMMLVAVAGWVNREQRAIIDYVKEENRVLRELNGEKRLRFTDDQRRRLAVKGKTLGRHQLREIESGFFGELSRSMLSTTTWSELIQAWATR